MPLFTKNIVSEKTILLGLIYTFVATLGCLFVFSIGIYLIYDCWPLSRYQFNSGICLENIQPQYLKFIPIVLGVLLGTIFTIKFND